MEGQLPPVIAAGQLQLPVQSLGIHTDTHRGDLQGAGQHLVPKEDITVELPIVVVRRAAIVGLTGTKRTADLQDAGGRMLLHKGIFSAVAVQFGIQILQLLGSHKGDLPAELGMQLGIAHLQPVIGIANRRNDGTNDELQIIEIPVFPGDDLLPVPLVYIDGMDIIQILVPADGIHVGIEAVSHAETVALQGQPLPLGQGMHHLGILAHGGNIEADRPLITVEIVIQT